MKEVWAYVDPSSGFVFLQNTFFLWSIALGLLTFFLLLLKFFFRSIKKFLWILIVLLVILVVVGVIMNSKDVKKEKLIILGIDAMDVSITQQLMNEGRLPNFSYLKTKGGFSFLKTTNPSESVVAWSSFMTGLNPAGHGIFDFVMRDPENYLPYLSLNEISPASGRPKIRIRRKGETFWNILSQNKISSDIYFCPNTFPSERVSGRMLSGMGVPDISGTMGKFSFYTSKGLSQEDKDSRGRIVQVMPDKGVIHTELYGPRISSAGLVTETKIPLKITIEPDREKVSLEFQGNQVFLNKGSWSNWQRISFKIGPFKKTYGITRFYLKSIKPNFELYASPINFDPRAPLFPISYPDNYSAKLAKKIGLYYTQGMPYDTRALTENRLNEEAFLELVDEILGERRKILNEGLKEFRSGLFFFYLGTLDVIQHMFWRYLDSKHPLYEKDSLHQDTIYKYYERMDQIVGDVLKGLDEDTTLIVLSDHGFSHFRKSVHLNRWLLENGFLFLKDGKNESKEFFKDVDWSKTKAYALGFGGIYLNRVGREYYGIVNEAEIQNLKRGIAMGLRQLKDSQTGEMIVKDVYFQEEIFKGPYINEAPDLFIGFNAGYRASWQTALGGVPNLIIEDNKKKWSGDHLVDPRLVNGLIFVNKNIDLKEASIIDIAPTILGFFGVTKPEEMQGKSLLQDDSK